MKQNKDKINKLKDRLYDEFVKLPYIVIITDEVIDNMIKDNIPSANLIAAVNSFVARVNKNDVNHSEIIVGKYLMKNKIIELFIFNKTLTICMPNQSIEMLDVLYDIFG